MDQRRRLFLKTAGLAGGAALAGISLEAPRSPVAAQAAATGGGAQELPMGMTFCTLERGAGTGLGLKTDRGILDVAAAEEALKENAPTTISAVLAGAGDLAGLKRLRDRAAASHFVAEDKAKFGPCVTNPEKIVCIGLNYRKHAAETGQPVPSAADLVQQVQHRAQLLRRRDRRVQGEGGEIRLRGRAGDRHRQHRAQCRRGRGAGVHFRLLHRQRLHRARPAIALEPMDARQNA